VDTDKLKEAGKKVLMVVIAAVFLGIPVNDYTTTADTASRWQKEAIATYSNEVYQAGMVGEDPPTLDEWVTDNSLTVALGVWQSLPTNITSALAGVFVLLQMLWPVFFKGKWAVLDSVMTWLGEFVKRIPAKTSNDVQEVNVRVQDGTGSTQK